LASLTWARRSDPNPAAGSHARSCCWHRGSARTSPPTTAPARRKQKLQGACCCVFCSYGTTPCPPKQMRP